MTAPLPSDPSRAATTPDVGPDAARPGDAAAVIATTGAPNDGTAPPRPAPGPPRPYHFPHFERRTLANGLTVVVAPVHKLPVVSVVAVVDAGAVCDPEGKEGLAVLTARALTEGTTTLDAVTLTDRVERLGSALDSGADWDSAVLSLTALTPKLADAFAVLADVLVNPVFPERELERLKGERLAELLHLRSDPGAMADEAFARAVYAAGSRFARAEAGGERAVAALTRDDVVAFHAARYRPGATTLVVAGDVSVNGAVALAEGALGAWRGDAAPRVRADDRAASDTRRVHIVEKADAAQAELRLGHVGVGRATGDYFPLLVMNSILGGLFNSRVNLNLRERHGYTYGARSGFDWRREAGPFAVESAVASDVAGAAAREMLVEVERIRDEPVTPEELSLATSYLGGVFPIRYETTSAIASALASAVVYGLPDDYFDRYRDRVRTVTAEAVRDAARRYLRPDALQLLAVGDAATLGPQLAALEFGPLVTHEAAAVVG